MHLPFQLATPISLGNLEPVSKKLVHRTFGLNCQSSTLPLTQGTCPTLRMVLPWRVWFPQALFAVLPRILGANGFLGDMLFHLEISEQVCRVGPTGALILGRLVRMPFAHSCGVSLDY